MAATYRILKWMDESAQTDQDLSTKAALSVPIIYQTGDHDFGAPEHEKRLTKLFVRDRMLPATGASQSYVATPYSEQVVARYDSTPWDITGTVAMDQTTYVTHRYVADQGANGYIQSIKITAVSAVRLAFSKVSAIYNKLAMR